MDANTCPRWDRCSAPICPMDENWRQRKHIANDPICFYLRERCKPNGQAIIGQVLQMRARDTIEENYLAIMEAHGDIRRACKRSSANGSRIEHGLRLKAGSYEQTY